MSASIIFSFLLVPTIGEASVNSILSVTKGIRGWLFALSFVCIGLMGKIDAIIEASEYLEVSRSEVVEAILAAFFKSLFNHMEKARGW